MMLAIALESVIKLVAMVAVGVFAYVWLSDRNEAVVESVHTLFTGLPPVGFIRRRCSVSRPSSACRASSMWRWWSAAMCATCAARAGCSAATVLISAMVLPIATAGISLFGTGSGVADDSMVLALPLAEAATRWH